MGMYPSNNEGQIEMTDGNLLEGKKILIVDDEPDVLDTLEELLPMCDLERALTFDEAREKLDNRYFDMAILDIMGVEGYRLLKIATRKNIVAVILTAHALTPDNLMKSYNEGAVSFVPKEQMTNLPALLNEILENAEKGRDYLWDCWLQQIDSLLEKKFGPEWKNKEKEFRKQLKPKG